MLDLTTLSGEALTAALAIDFATAENDALTAALAEQRKAGDTLFALTEPTITQIKTAVAIKTSVKAIDAEIKARAKAVEDAAAEFAAARAEFSVDADPEVDPEVDPDADPEVDPDADVDPEVDPDVDPDADAEPGEGEGGDAVTASDRQTITAAAAKKAVAKGTKRPAARLADKPIVITASGENIGFAIGDKMNGHSDVAKAFIKKATSFPQFNSRAAEARREATGGAPEIKPFDLASFGVNFPSSLTASGGEEGEYNAMRNAISEHTKALTASLKSSQSGGQSLKEALTAAGWCAPSEPVYSYIADYVVDGLFTVPQVNAPRGGLLTTTGPARSSQGAALDDFGFVQTEAQAIANTVKPLEGIVCPAFVDNRLDAIGYGFTIPFLTQKAYPELIADTLKFAGVLWSHKLNRRRINQALALADAKTFEGYGPSTTDTLEVFSLIALNERRKWNLGRNAIMEVKVPLIALEIFRADMSRRSGLALDDVATEQKINAHFAARGLAVEYLSDWAEISYGSEIVLPGTFPALMYPAGTFVEAVEDVVNLSAFYDTASVTVNQYTGVFFEQGQMLIKVGYGATKLTIPVNTAGQSGALNLTGAGDARENGSF